MSVTTTPRPAEYRVTARATEPFRLIDQDGFVTWLIADGELDLVSAPQVKYVIERVLERTPMVVVDLAAVTFIDTAGVQAFLDADAAARAQDRRLILVRCSALVTRLFGVTGVRDQLRIVRLSGLTA